MYLMTSLEMIFFPIAFMFSPISISGWGGVHHPEPKCHVDLISNFFISGGGYISQKQNVTLTWNPTFLFFLGGGVHCLPILRLNMNAKESIVFMVKVHLPHAQTTANCPISLTITNSSNFNFFNSGGGYFCR